MRRNEIEDAFKLFGDDLKRGIHTISPGYIESYDPEKRTASVIIPFTDFYQTDGETPVNLDWAPIPDCPVWMLGGGGFVVAPPLKKGDPCLVLFCQRDIDKWWESDGQTTVTPALVDTHTESDVIVLAGRLFPQQAIIGEADAESLQISHEDGLVHLKIKSDGEVQIKATNVRLGALDADKPLALAEPTETRLARLEDFASSHQHICPAGTSFSTTPPLVGGGENITSETVFSDA